MLDSVCAYSHCLSGPVGWGLRASHRLAGLRFNVSLEEIEGRKLGKSSCFSSLGTICGFSGYTMS